MDGSDYVGLNISLPFSDTLTRQCVNITILQEGDVELEETFSVNLNNFSPFVALTTPTAMVTIVDSDCEMISVKIIRV